MAIPEWLHAIVVALKKGRVPTRRRRAKWAAEREFEKALRELRPGDIAIDCGANVGLFTRKMAATGATVYAFEPDPYAFEILQQRLKTVPNVKLSNVAVGIGAAQVQLFRSVEFETDPEAKTISSSLFLSKGNMDQYASITIEQIDLCSFIASLRSDIHILKLDIEGAEVPILERLIEMDLIKNMKYIFVETHEKQIPEISGRTELLKKEVKSKNLSNINLDWK